MRTCSNCGALLSQYTNFVHTVLGAAVCETCYQKSRVSQPNNTELKRYAPPREHNRELAMNKPPEFETWSRQNLEQFALEAWRLFESMKRKDAEADAADRNKGATSYLHSKVPE